MEMNGPHIILSCFRIPFNLVVNASAENNICENNTKRSYLIKQLNFKSHFYG